MKYVVEMGSDAMIYILSNFDFKLSQSIVRRRRED
jgi:hypothetical protein